MLYGNIENIRKCRHRISNVLKQKLYDILAFVGTSLYKTKRTGVKRWGYKEINQKSYRYSNSKKKFINVGGGLTVYLGPTSKCKRLKLPTEKTKKIKKINYMFLDVKKTVLLVVLYIKPDLYSNKKKLARLKSEFWIIIQEIFNKRDGYKELIIIGDLNVRSFAWALVDDANLAYNQIEASLSWADRSSVVSS